MSSSTQYIPLFEATTFSFPEGIEVILELWRDNDSGNDIFVTKFLWSMREDTQ